MQVRTFGCALDCMQATTIAIELSLSKGTHRIISGLPDDTIKESLARIDAALSFSGFFVPASKYVFNLFPASIRKTGSGLDLPMAIALLAASGQLSSTAMLENYLIMGELTLDGSVQPIKGSLSIALHAWKEKFKGVIVPYSNVEEAALVSKIPVYGVKTLQDVVQFLNGQLSIEPHIVNTRELFFNSQYNFDIDYKDVKGQKYCLRAFEILAAGGHSGLVLGPPGAGKSLISARLPTILPPLTLSEALEVTQIYSACDKLTDGKKGLISRRPFVTPHHTCSNIALVGGGSFPSPGLISLAHCGVLFLDELPEFQRSSLEALRQPIESGHVKIARASQTMTFPASFMLVASMNPCKCGYLNHPERKCSCSLKSIQKYLDKISGPLLDRIDLCVEVFPVSVLELSQENHEAEDSATIRQRVIKARAVQTERFKENEKVHTNSQMNSQQIKKFCKLEKDATELLIHAMQSLQLSGRAYDCILKVGRSIADLEGSPTIRHAHITEAIGYRSFDKENWIAAASNKGKNIVKKTVFKIA